MKNLNAIDWLAIILTIIGGINWGLVGAIKLDLVSTIFGAGTITRVVYILVGVSALYLLLIIGKLKKE